MVQAKLAQLGKQWGVAEGLLLAQGRVEEAIQMYTQAHKWDDAIGYAFYQAYKHVNEAIQT